MKTTVRRGNRPLSVWELPKLATLVHVYRRTQHAARKERPHFPAILAFVFRNRLATADQIRRRFPQYLRSSRTARRTWRKWNRSGYSACSRSATSRR